MLGQILLWSVIIISSIFTMFWILVYVFYKDKGKYVNNLKDYPKVTIAVPAYNEESTITHTLASLLSLDYPSNKLEIIVVDDGSKDNTFYEVKKFIKEKDKKGLIKIIRHKRNKGKGHALNTALSQAHGEYFVVMDADTVTTKSTLKNLVKEFLSYKNNIGAIISHIKVWNVNNFITKLQRFEYIYTQFMRNLMSKVNLLYITPGAFTIYKTDVLKKIGGFDETTLTEDFEVALRLKYERYSLRYSEKAIVRTKVPQTFRSYVLQRLRWNLGFIENTSKYFLKFLKRKDFSLFGHVFYPAHLFSLLLLTLYVLNKLYFFFYNSYFTLKAWIYSQSLHLFDTTVHDLLMSIHYDVFIPLTVLLMMGLLIYKWAFKHGKEDIIYPFHFLLYFIFYSILTIFIWIYSYIYYIINGKKKWFR